MITPATISPGVVITPAGADLTGDDRIRSLAAMTGSRETVARCRFARRRQRSFIWNPGDGDDTAISGSGTDTLEFNGSDDADLMTSPRSATVDSASSAILGDITVDTRGVERVEVNALWRQDTIDGSAQTRSSVTLRLTGAPVGRLTAVPVTNSLRAEAAMTNALGWRWGRHNRRHCGNDFISGGNGLDDMSGGGGADTFYFGSAGEAPFNIRGRRHHGLLGIYLQAT